MSHLGNQIQIDNLQDEEIDFNELSEEYNRMKELKSIQNAVTNVQTIQEASKELEREIRQNRQESVDDYVKEEKVLSALHTDIVNCDQQLAEMEKILINFQSHLSSLTSEIRNLQDESLTMNVKLKNRKSLSQKVSEYLQRITISDDVKRVIEQGPMKIDAPQFNNTSPLLLAEIAQLSMEATQPLLSSLSSDVDLDESGEAMPVSDIHPLKMIDKELSSSSIASSSLTSSQESPQSSPKSYEQSLNTLPFSNADLPFLSFSDTVIPSGMDSRPSSHPSPLTSHENTPSFPSTSPSSGTASLSPELIQILMSCITYCSHLRTLQKSIDNAASDNLNVFPSAKDATIILNKHASYAIQHSRDYLSNAIRIIRSNDRQTHTRVIKEILLRSSGMYAFLARNSPDAAEDIKKQYIEASSRNIMKLTKGYVEMITKGIVEISTSKDLIGEKDKSTQKVIPSSTYSKLQNPTPIDQSKPGSPTTTSIFELSDRHYVLSPTFSPIPAGYAKHTKNVRWTLEEAFVSCHYPLCCFAIQETVFSVQFFSSAQPIKPTLEPITHLFRSLFVPLITASSDLFSLLIIARHIASMRTILHRQGTIVLDEYISELEMQIWPRYRQVVEMHSKSMMKLTMELTDQSSMKKLVSRLQSKVKDKALPVTVHFTTQRCAHLVKGIWTLCRTIPSNQFVVTETKSLLDSLLSFYSLFSKEYESPRSDAFLAINTGHTLSVWKEDEEDEEKLKDTDEVLMKKEWRDRFEEVYRTALHKHTEFHLTQHFRTLLGLTNTILAVLSKNREPNEKTLPIRESDYASLRSAVEEQTVEAIVNEYNQNWRQNITNLHDSIVEEVTQQQDSAILLRDARERVIACYSLFIQFLNGPLKEKPFRSSALAFPQFESFTKSKL
ncbi:Vps52 [Blattamonas nauphoetae]|uniref:Vps52 n=1 Tax=Blattamonas nauphoetae TaxID=2049346 RepID=A0ABQ9Y4B3_9EUKA|nr:Vps52 [Blattamonas nauphoetae]